MKLAPPEVAHGGDLRAEAFMRELVPRHWLDIGRDDLAFAVAASLRSLDEARSRRRLDSWLPEGSVACLSVRSGFDLLLSALDLPRGSEVMVSAITIPDMARILEAHSLVPVPIDLDAQTLTPLPGALEAALSPRTRAVLVAHLFGARTDLRETAEFAERNGLVLVEDAAQAFQGPTAWGDPRASVSMWSFGIIKTATALGGAVIVVRDPGLASRMRALQTAWPLQPPSKIARRAVNLLALSTVSAPRRYAALAGALEHLGQSVEGLLASATRGFKGLDDQEFLAAIRRRPSPALLALLERRFATFDGERLRLRAAIGARLAQHLDVLGDHQSDHTHWLLPARVRDPVAFIATLRRAGFDATRGASSLEVVRAPGGRAEAITCQSAMNEVVYVPAYPEIDARAEARLIATIAKTSPD